MSESSPKKIVKIYQDPRGKEPFIEWLESIQDITTRARIKNRVRRIELGNLGDCKSVGKGVFELRLHFGAGYRAYCGQAGHIVVILLCGGDKRTQTQDIALAQHYWADYKESEEYEKDKEI